MEALISAKPGTTKVSNNIKKTFPVLGMTCAACAVSVESILKSAKGVHDAGVNYANQTAWAEYDQTLKPVDLQNLIRSVGYDLIVDSDDPQQEQQQAQLKQYEQLKERTIWAAVLSFPIVIIGMFFMDKVPYGNWIMMALSAPVVFYLGRSFFINAFKQAKYDKANMDTLVALSTGIAFVFSAFNTDVVLLHKKLLFC